MSSFVDSTLLKSGEYSLDEFFKLIDEYGIGVPHFQRGLVWDDKLKENLIESLFREIPIGTFMLWSGNQIEKDGIHMFGGNDSRLFRYLIVDGQQRISTLINFYKNVNFDLNKEGYEWFIDIDAFKKGIDFIYYGELSKNMPNRDRLKPLKGLIKNDIKYLKDIDLLKKNKSKDLCLPTEIFNQKINVKIIEADEIKKIIQIYIKINSSIKPVKKEEKMYATLLRLGKSFSNNFNIRDLYNKVHPDAKYVENPRVELTRKREYQFGFDVFIKILLQNFYYHFGFDLKIDKEFNLDRIEDIVRYIEISTEKNDSVVKSSVEKIIQHSKKIILFLANSKDGIIRNELKFDDLRFFPDIGFKCIQPAIQLMITFPDSVIKKNKNLYSRILLLLLIANLEYKYDTVNKTYINLIIEQNSIDIFSEAIKKIELYAKTEIKDLMINLKDIDTINNHYIDLLYGLERTYGARDVSVKNIIEDKRAKFIQGYNKVYTTKINKNLRMPELSKEIEPTRQHIIPVKNKRDSRGEWHNVGNITYISDKINCLDGLKENPMNLDYEISEKNTKGHFLSKEFIQYYKKIQSESLEDMDWQKYLKRRQKEISHGLHNWVTKFKNKYKKNIDKEFRQFLIIDKLFLHYSDRFKLIEHNQNEFSFKINEYFNLEIIQIIEDSPAESYIQIKVNKTRINGRIKIVAIWNKIKKLENKDKTKYLIINKQKFCLPKNPPRKNRLSIYPEGDNVNIKGYKSLINYLIKTIKNIKLE